MKLGGDARSFSFQTMLTENVIYYELLFNSPKPRFLEVSFIYCGEQGHKVCLHFNYVVNSEITRTVFSTFLFKASQEACTMILMIILNLKMLVDSRNCGRLLCLDGRESFLTVAMRFRSRRAVIGCRVSRRRATPNSSRESSSRCQSCCIHATCNHELPRRDL